MKYTSKDVYSFTTINLTMKQVKYSIDTPALYMTPKAKKSFFSFFTQLSL